MCTLIKRSYILSALAAVAVIYSLYLRSELSDLNYGTKTFNVSESTPHGIGKYDGECLRSVVGERGNLVSGPTVKLEVGQYLAKFHVSATNINPQVQAATLDVFANVNGQPKVLGGYAIDSDEAYKNRYVLFM